MEVTSSQKVLLATFKLEGNVEIWLKTIYRAYQSKNENMPKDRRKARRWSKFLQVFQQQYVSKVLKDYNKLSLTN